MEINSFAGYFSVITDFIFLVVRWIARSVVPFARICAFVFARVHNAGARAWGDDLIAVLFEFLDDDTKLARSCTHWLFVQHWYTVVPEPAMRMGAGGNCHEHIHCTPLHFLLFSVFHLQEVFAMDRFVSKRSSAHVLRSFEISFFFWRSFWIRSLLWDMASIHDSEATLKATRATLHTSCSHSSRHEARRTCSPATCPSSAASRAASRRRRAPLLPAPSSMAPSTP